MYCHYIVTTRAGLPAGAAQRTPEMSPLHRPMRAECSMAVPSIKRPATQRRSVSTTNQAIHQCMRAVCVLPAGGVFRARGGGKGITASTLVRCRLQYVPPLASRSPIRY